jgi:membrane protein DedA with SNARE-associated domain
LEFFQDLITNTVADYGYLAIFVLVALGSACIPIPSEIVLLFGGALASETFATEFLTDPTKQVNLVAVLLVALAGGMVGSWLGFWMGYAGGRPLIDRWGRYLLFRPHEVDRAHEWFERHGEALVFFGRLVPLLRAFVSLPAGIAKMDLRKFSLFTFLGILPWTVGFTLAGYYLGEQWLLVERWFRPLAVLAGVILLAGIIWWIAKRLRQHDAGGSV